MIHDSQFYHTPMSLTPACSSFTLFAFLFDTIFVFDVCQPCASIYGIFCLNCEEKEKRDQLGS